jgi:hypothetical protein
MGCTEQLHQSLFFGQTVPQNKAHNLHARPSYSEPVGKLGIGPRLLTSRSSDRLDVMHAAAVPLRADLGAAWGGEAIDFALAPSKRWVSVSAGSAYRKSSRCLLLPRAKFITNTSHVLPKDGGKT